MSTNEYVNDGICGFTNYLDLFENNPSTFNTLLKLDNITVLHNNISKQVTELGYGLSNSERLQLTAVKNTFAGSSTQEYGFKYKSDVPDVQLPEYGVGKVDHWGFFNNKSFFETIPPDISFNNKYNYSTISNYPTFREPDPIYSSAEILTTIKYPTGGSIEFEYQQNDYSRKKASSTNFSVIDIGSNLPGGGVRIKKIKYFNGDNKLAQTKTFDYSLPASPELSSGILSILPQNYLMGNSSHFQFSASGFDPIYYNGNPVTYTYVEEKQENNGKVLYEFTNSDNGYSDMAPLETNVAAGNSFQFQYAYQNNGFKRGKVISEKIFDETGDPIKETLPSD